MPPMRRRTRRYMPPNCRGQALVCGQAVLIGPFHQVRRYKRSGCPTLNTFVVGTQMCLAAVRHVLVEHSVRMLWSDRDSCYYRLTAYFMLQEGRGGSAAALTRSRGADCRGAAGSQ